MQNGNSGLTATYLWNDPLGQTTSTATGLLPGTYICSITLSNGCTGTTSVTVGTQPAMQITQNSNNSVSCFGGTNGSLSVSVINGTALICGQIQQLHLPYQTFQQEHIQFKLPMFIVVL
jgi:hypothetical protein